MTSAAAIALGLAVGGWGVAGATSSSNAKAPSDSPGSSSAPGSRPPGGGSPPAAVGTVASVGDSTFTLTTKAGTVTVDVSSTTTYADRDVTSPTITDVTVGEHVAVFGTSSSGIITATSVAIGMPPTGRSKGAPPTGGKGGPPGGGKGAPPNGTGGPPGAAPSGSSSS